MTVPFTCEVVSELWLFPQRSFVTGNCVNVKKVSTISTCIDLVKTKRSGPRAPGRLRGAAGRTRFLAPRTGTMGSS